MRLAYFDCFSGLSGNMALAALIHAGADVGSVRSILHTFPVDDFEIEVEEVELRGIASLRVQVVSAPQSVIRTYSSIRTLLDQADLPASARRIAQRAYQRLAESSAIVHGKEPDLVTFHEFGAMDCLVDLVGCALALDQLGVERVFSSPVPTGFGMVRTEHGMMPIPSPVVMELLRGVPAYSRGIPDELVTPTGAAFLSAVSEGYGEMPLMRTDRVGYGAGVLRLDFPNVVRVAIGEEQPAGMTARSWTSLFDLMLEGDVLIQATLRGIDPDHPDSLLNRLADAGAVDAWFGYVEGRAGESRRVVLSLVAPGNLQADMVEILRSERPVRILISPVFAAPTNTQGHPHSV
jgi:pyridinium-3,5-bisthiocarboxylic acid mononucleotide nickel chelatase